MNTINFNNKIQIVLFLLVIILFIMYYNMYIKISKNEENFTNISNEALQSLAAVYNSETITVKNIVATGNISVAGDTQVNGTLTVKNIVAGDTQVNERLTVKNIVSGDTQVNGTITVKNIVATDNISVEGDTKVNGTLTVPKTTNLGNWNITNNRMGIKDIGDINLNADGWLRFNKYGDMGTGPTSYAPQGFAGNNFTVW